MSDSYYELIDDAGRSARREVPGHRHGSQYLVGRIQHGGPVSALLVRAMERCAPRDDTRLCRVVIDLLGGVPAEGDLWVSAQVQRGGRQIELVSAVMLAPGSGRSPVRSPGPADGGSSAGHRGMATRPRRRRARGQGRNRNSADKIGTATTSTAWNGGG